MEVSICKTCMFYDVCDGDGYCKHYSSIYGESDEYYRRLIEAERSGYYEEWFEYIEEYD